jgi:hypothetical protein
MTTRTLTIEIAVNVDGDQISGTARSGPGTGTPFIGWLGLMSAVDSLVGLKIDPLTSPPGYGGRQRTGAEQ